jgi:hypothetical protein
MFTLTGCEVLEESQQLRQRLKQARQDLEAARLESSERRRLSVAARGPDGRDRSAPTSMAIDVSPPALPNVA